MGLGIFDRDDLVSFPGDTTPTLLGDKILTETSLGGDGGEDGDGGDGSCLAGGPVD